MSTWELFSKGEHKIYFDIKKKMYTWKLFSGRELLIYSFPSQARDFHSQNTIANHRVITTYSAEYDDDTGTLSTVCRERRAPAVNPQSQEVSVGRDRTCTICNPDPTVSGFHCRLVLEGNVLKVLAGAFDPFGNLVLSYLNPLHVPKYNATELAKIAEIELYTNDGFCSSMTIVDRPIPPGSYPNHMSYIISAFGVPYTLETIYVQKLRTKILKPGRICSQGCLGISPAELFRQIEAGTYTGFPLKHGDTIRLGEKQISVSLQ